MCGFYAVFSFDGDAVPYGGNNIPIPFKFETEEERDYWIGINPKLRKAVSESMAYEWVNVDEYGNRFFYSTYKGEPIKVPA